MKTFYVTKDFDVEISKGEKGIFQVITILDDQKNDLSGKLASGLFFKDDRELIAYLKDNFSMPDEVMIKIIEEK